MADRSASAGGSVAAGSCPRGWRLRSAVRAACDAARAWSIIPHVHRNAGYAQGKNGAWHIRYRVRFRVREVLRLKFVGSMRVFVASLRLRVARDIVVPHYPEEGLLANFLHVLEVVHRVRPDARVRVDWTIAGTERAFRYAKQGQDVWGQLFQALAPPLPGTAHRALWRVDFAFWGKGKDHLTGKKLQTHREGYHSTLLQWVGIHNRRVLAQIDEICNRQLRGRFCIGVHRRVGNALVANLQADGRIPSMESTIQTVQSIMRMATTGGNPDCAVYLATDDAEAVGVFKDAFGSLLIVRDGVQRTTADGTEVHFREWDRLSITDAEDALIDAVLLSQCNVMVHTCSSVSTVASIMNPALILVRA